MGEVNYAYLREYQSSQQCELCLEFSFSLLNIPQVKDLNVNIKAVSPVAAPVRELISETEEKLVNIIEEKLTEVDGNNAQSVKLNGIKLVSSGNEIKGTTIIKNVITNFGNDLKLHILEQEFYLRLNAPLIKRIELPSLVMADHIIEPIKFHALFIDKKASKYIWYKSKDKDKWKKIGKGYKYSVTKDDIGYFLKLVCVPYNTDMIAGPAAELITENMVDTVLDLPDRVTHIEKRHKLTPHRLRGKEFRVVSYNILAERYTDDNQFYYCPPKALCIHYRKQLILNEIKGYNADIVCLQEVDETHFLSYFKLEFKKLGFNSFYNRKGNRIPEGLACLYNTVRYKKLDIKHIVLKYEIERRKIFSSLWKLLESNPNLKETFMQQNTSLQVTVLQSQVKKTRLTIVGNTHLYYHPDANDIRLIQANMAAIFLNSVRKKYLQDTADVSVIFCGDFNSSPDRSLFSFFTKGSVAAEHPDVQKIAGNSTTKLSTDLVFESACGTPKYTNYTVDFKGCLDYMFIEGKKIGVKSVIPLPSEKELTQYEGLPNEFFPSDHLALVADLKYK